MITCQAIEDAKTSGMLIPFVPAVPWASRPRAFLMTKRLDKEIKAGCASPDRKRYERWERLRADMAHYTENGFVSWSFMKWLQPKKFEHWELKSVRPRPSLRVFGRFARPNIFVGTHVVERSPLGAKWSLEWELEKLSCEELWNEAFGGSDPFRSAIYEHYITENASRDLGVPR